MSRALCIVFILFILDRGIKAVRVLGRNESVPVGEDATLFCQLVESTEKLTRIMWQRRTGAVHTKKTFLIINPDGKTEDVGGFGDRVEFIGSISEMNGTILLRHVTLSDEQIYTCIFNIFASVPYERDIHLVILVPPVVSVTPDVIPVVGESEVILATCTAAKSRPAAQVLWNLGALNGSVRIETKTHQDSDGSYTVKSHLIGVASKELNHLLVKCLVTHPGLKKELELDYAVTVHYPPQIVYIIQIGDPDGPPEFQCVAEANPQPTKYIWSRVNKTLSGNIDFDRLRVPRSSDHNGLYICNTSNQYGHATGTLYIHISTESSPVCWSLFTILIICFIVVELIWRCNLIGRLTELSSLLRDRFHSRHGPVPGSPSRSGDQSHRARNTDESSTDMDQG